MEVATIADLRKRAWSLTNKSIDALNDLNACIYEHTLNIPVKIENITEDINNISLEYIQDGLDFYNNYIPEINNKMTYLISIQNKHQECVLALKQIME